MIIWRKEMSVGNPMIDGDHRYLICLINTVELALSNESYKDVLDTVLDQLDEYTREHFAREEKLQLELYYLKRDEHAQQHAELIRELGEIRRKVRSVKEPDMGKEIAGEIALLLRHWLIDHILQRDMLMKPLFGQ